MNPDNVDFAIAGAGVVGVTAAMLLAREGFSVVLIDPAPPPQELAAPYDLRTYALTPASLRVLRAIGVDATLDHERVAPFVGMHVWDARSDGTLRFDARQLGRDTLGAIVEHQNIHVALHRLRAGHSGPGLITAAVAGVAAGADRMTVELDNGGSLSAAIVLGCDGASSPSRARLGVPANGTQFRQHAIVCNVETEHPHDSIARQRFLPEGPLAFLPLPPDQMSAIVWSMDPERAAAAVRASDEVFTGQLAEAFDGELGAVRSTTARIAIPLQSLHLPRYVVGRTVLLGDAAHVVHPLAGQGLNLGILDAAALAEVFGERDPLDLKFPRAALERFERLRRGENLAMLKLTNGLNRLFRDDHRFVQRARGAGMRAVDAVAPLKHWLMLRAMGDVGDVPRIAAFGRSPPA